MEGVSVSVKLWFLVVCVVCEVLCCLVIAITTINTNNTSNYQSANETQYTHQNTTITTYKGSQLLILTETRYQLQPSNKELHTQHTPLRTITLH